MIGKPALSDQAEHAKPKPKLRVINSCAAGIDVGADEIYVAVSADKSDQPVRRYGTTTPDLDEMAQWLVEVGVSSVAMESTGVYWLPVFSALERFGLETHLVDARRLHTAPGRKTDVCDAQWLQELHSFGLLSKVVILPEENRRLRCLLRLRETFVRSQGQAIQRMQKAMTEMNIRLDRVLTDITGKTGMSIIRSILAGETSPEELVRHRHNRCKHSPEDFVKALTGQYTPEHLFALEQHVAALDFYELRLSACETQIESLIATMQEAPSGQTTSADPFAPFIPKDELASTVYTSPQEKRLHELFGVNLVKIPGIGAQTVLTLLAEVGTDLRRWRSAKAFASWLGLCPHPRISGGRILSTRSKRSSNRASQALRMAASGLYRNDSYIGSFHQRMRFRKEKASAVTATAHLLARTIWTCVVRQEEYREQGSAAFEQKQLQRKRRQLIKLSQELGIEIPAA